MPDAAPIGRETELADLLERAQKAVAGQGSIVFLAGPTGSGKSFLLKTFTERIAALEADPKPEVVSVLCYDTSPDNPLGPFGEILRSLTSKDRRGDKAKEILGLIKDVAPPLVELIPVVGKLAALGVQTGAAIGIHALGGDHEQAQAQLASDVAASLENISTKVPLVLVIDDAHWIDGPSTEVIARLAQEAGQHGILLIVAYDPTLVTDRDLIARVRSSILTLPGVTRIELADLDAGTIDALLAERYGALQAKHFGEWLHDRTDGSPLFVTQYLDALEEQGVLAKTASGWTLDGGVEGAPGEWRLSGKLAAAETPDTLAELLGPRVADLEDDERELLDSGAVQGRRFLSTVLVTVLKAEEDEILNRLARIQERRRMIEAEDTEDWWSDRSNLYSFDPSVLQEILYSRSVKTAYERKRRHEAVAKALEELIAGEDPPPRHALLEIARHYESAGDGLAAGGILLDVARSTYAEGADAETAANAERAADLLRAALPKVPEAEKAKANGLLAQAVVLQLLGGEPSWRGEDSGDDLVALADEGVRAADAAGDVALRANARYAQALVFTGYRGLNEGIACYQDARKVAEEGGADPVTRLSILMNLGHQLDSVSLDEGWAVLQEAHALLTGPEFKGILEEKTLGYETARLEMTIGVAAFDRGDYGQALELLGRSADVLRTTHRRGDLGWGLNFLGQLSIAMGLYEAAEGTLEEAIALFPEEDTVALRGYLRALLGHLYLEWDPPKLDQARAELEGARAEVDDAAYRAVAPLVTSHWAELALAEKTPEGLRAAEEALADTETYGWARSDITVASLRGRIALAEGRTDDAVKLSTAAVEELAKRGGAVPATRSEEILHAHAAILGAAGSPEAATFAKQAADVVRSKAESLKDPDQRRSFLERVRLSREILAAVDSKEATKEGS